MSDPFQDENSVDIRGTLTRLLPTLLIALIFCGYALIVGMQLLPTYQEYSQLNQAVTQNAIDIAATATSGAVDVGLIAIQTQVANLETQLETVTQSFLTEDEVNSILGQLYNHAMRNEIIITSLQAQAENATNATPNIFEQLSFDLQAEGRIANLMKFLISSNELRSDGSKVSNIAIEENADQQYALTIEISFFVMENAPGTVLEQVEILELPTPPSEQLALIHPTPTLSDPNATPDPNEVAIIASANDQQSGESSDTDSGCGKAPPTIFRPGDTAIVDFDDDSALNVLSAARTGEVDIEVIYVAYDDARMQLINGPICGKWEGYDVLYWYVNYSGRTGWVGEATEADRFLCPIDNPECSS